MYAVISSWHIIFLVSVLVYTARSLPHCARVMLFSALAHPGFVSPVAEVHVGRLRPVFQIMQVCTQKFLSFFADAQSDAADVVRDVAAVAFVFWFFGV